MCLWGRNTQEGSCVERRVASPSRHLKWNPSRHNRKKGDMVYRCSTWRPCGRNEPALLSYPECVSPLSMRIPRDPDGWRRRGRRLGRHPSRRSSSVCRALNKCPRSCVAHRIPETRGIEHGRAKVPLVWSTNRLTFLTGLNLTEIYCCQWGGDACGATTSSRTLTFVCLDRETHQRARVTDVDVELS